MDACVKRVAGSSVVVDHPQHEGGGSGVAAFVQGFVGGGELFCPAKWVALGGDGAAGRTIGHAWRGKGEGVGRDGCELLAAVEQGRGCACNKHVFAEVRAVAVRV